MTPRFFSFRSAFASYSTRSLALQHIRSIFSHVAPAACASGTVTQRHSLRGSLLFTTLSFPSSSDLACVLSHFSPLQSLILFRAHTHISFSDSAGVSFFRRVHTEIASTPVVRRLKKSKLVANSSNFSRFSYKSLTLPTRNTLYTLLAL